MHKHYKVNKIAIKKDLIHDISMIDSKNKIIIYYHKFNMTNLV